MEDVRSTNGSAQQEKSSSWPLSNVTFNGTAPEPVVVVFVPPDEDVLAEGNASFSSSTFLPTWNTSTTASTASVAEIQCLEGASKTIDTKLESVLSCLPAWDGLSCLPRTPAAHTVSIPCFSTLNGVNYDSTQNASRFCSASGVWAGKSDYSHCVPVLEVERPIDGTTLYYIGYGMSLCALSIALWIFLYYKELRCLRNTIHVNLMVTYFLISITWITTATLQSVPSPAYHKSACFMYVVLTYLMGTNFFWMFVEGLYLFILVVKTFSIELIRAHVYVVIGWAGIPLVVVAVWAVTKAYLSPNHNYPNLSGGMCIWQLKDIYDCIFIGPVMLVLLTNIFFLSQIMWVLITKLRAATSVESQQYRKAAKALLVLIPLLGVSYILVIWTPQHKTAKVVFTYLQIALLSTQGFSVAVLYCFLNGEVRNSVRHHLERWKTMRALRRGGDRCRQALGCGRSHKPFTLQRGSCVSFTTTTTSCLPAAGSRFPSQHSKRASNGSYAQLPFSDNPV